MIKIDLNDLDKFFEKGELIPAICYEVNTKTVLMLAYMNKESLKKTLETGYTHRFSTFSIIFLTKNLLYNLYTICLEVFELYKMERQKEVKK